MGSELHHSMIVICYFVDWLMKCQHSTVISLQMDLVTLPRLWFHQSLIKKTITFYLSA